MKNKNLTPQPYKSDMETQDEMQANAKMPEEWEVKDWAEIMKKAHHIKSDKHKMKHVSAHLAKEKSAIDAINPKEGIDGLRRHINKKGTADS